MKKLIAECLGTFVIVFCGTGAIIADQEFGGMIGHLGISLTFGLVVMGMIYALGNISGAHFNPAVTIAFWISGKFPVQLLLPYFFSQLIGALAASLILKGFFPHNLLLGATIPIGSEMQSFWVEFLLTLILMLVILLVSQGSKERGAIAGLIIGLVIFLGAFFAGPISGASMNPARSFGPAIASGRIDFLWIYFTATIAGAIAAVGLWKCIPKNPQQDNQIKVD